MYYNISGFSPSIKELLKENSNKSHFVEELIKALRREHDSQYNYTFQKEDKEITITQNNPLLDVKTNPHFSVPAETDALLLVMIKTHIAKRTLFGNLSDQRSFSNLPIKLGTTPFAGADSKSRPDFLFKLCPEPSFSHQSAADNQTLKYNWRGHLFAVWCRRKMLRQFFLDNPL